MITFDVTIIPAAFSIPAAHNVSLEPLLFQKTAHGPTPTHADLNWENPCGSVACLFLPVAVLADVPFDDSDERVKSLVGFQLCFGQLCDLSFGSFLGVAEPADDTSDRQDGFRKPADLLLVFRDLSPSFRGESDVLLAHLLHVGSELGLLLKDELHRAAHFLVGHLLPHAGILN